MYQVTQQVIKKIKKTKPLQGNDNGSDTYNGTICLIFKIFKDMEDNTILVKTKRCYKCNRILPITEFHKSSRNKDGLQYECKECRREFDKERRKRSKEKSELKKVYTNPDLACFNPRQLMEELKRRGFTWDYMLEPQKKIFFNKI